MRILGIDPGTAIVGFGVIDVDGQEKTMIDAGVIRTPANQELELVFTEREVDRIMLLVLSHEDKVTDASGYNSSNKSKYHYECTET